nr:Chain A, HH2 [synthetic construct]
AEDCERIRKELEKNPNDEIKKKLEKCQA